MQREAVNWIVERLQLRCHLDIDSRLLSFDFSFSSTSSFPANVVFFLFFIVV